MFRSHLNTVLVWSCSIAILASVLCVHAQGSAPLIVVQKEGAKKDSVALAFRVSGAQGRLFQQTLQRDLERSGWFKLVQGNQATVTLSGSVAESGSGISSALRCAWGGRSFPWTRSAQGQQLVRLQAHQLADEMVRLIKGEKGIAQTKIAFVNRRGSNNADLYVSDVDGGNFRQITRDNVAIVGPRWAPNGNTLFYTSFIQGYPTILKQTLGGGRSSLAPFRGLNTGAAVSPDGSTVALILSYQGNPELYTLHLASGRLVRLTSTKTGVEASPCWSPDGQRIVYVSDVSRTPQLYIIQVASKKSTRITFRGSENVNPDWNEKGKIAYATRRSGSYQIAILDPRSGGEAAAEIVPSSAGFEHPSWAPDSRHIACSSGSSIYILDALGDPPVRLTNVAGKWISPDWSSK